VLVALVLYNFFHRSGNYQFARLYFVLYVIIFRASGVIRIGGFFCEIRGLEAKIGFPRCAGGLQTVFLIFIINRG
jgi:hypothetical protein